MGVSDLRGTRIEARFNYILQSVERTIFKASFTNGNFVKREKNNCSLGY